MQKSDELPQSSIPVLVKPARMLLSRYGFEAEPLEDLNKCNTPSYSAKHGFLDHEVHAFGACHRVHAAGKLVGDVATGPLLFNLKKLAQVVYFLCVHLFNTGLKN